MEKKCHKKLLLFISKPTAPHTDTNISIICEMYTINKSVILMTKSYIFVVVSVILRNQLKVQL